MIHYSNRIHVTSTHLRRVNVHTNKRTKTREADGIPKPLIKWRRESQSHELPQREESDEEAEQEVDSSADRMNAVELDQQMAASRKPLQSSGGGDDYNTSAGSESVTQPATSAQSGASKSGEDLEENKFFPNFRRAQKFNF